MERMRKNVKQKLNRETYKYIEAELRGYHASRRELKQMELDIITAAPVIDNPEGSSSGIGDPTARKALTIINAKRLNRIFEVASAIESTYAILNDEERRLVALRYWSNRYKDAGIADELHISRMTLHRWADKIVLAIAVKLGFID